MPFPTTPSLKPSERLSAEVVGSGDCPHIPSLSGKDPVRTLWGRQGSVLDTASQSFGSELPIGLAGLSMPRSYLESLSPLRNTFSPASVSILVPHDNKEDLFPDAPGVPDDPALSPRKWELCFGW